MSSARPAQFDVWWEPFPGVLPVRGTTSRQQYNREMERMGGTAATLTDHLSSNRKKNSISQVIPAAFRYCDALDRGEWFEQSDEYEGVIRPPIWWEGRLWQTLCSSSIDELTSRFSVDRSVNTGMRFINARRQAAVDAGREYGFDGESVDVWWEDNYQLPVWDAITGAISGATAAGVPGAVLGGAAGWTLGGTSATGTAPPAGSSLPATIRQMSREQRLEVARVVMYEVERQVVLSNRDAVWAIILNALEV